jgi:hypothetical protein
MKPRIYIAGKIQKNDFRHAIIPGLRDHNHSKGHLDCGRFLYVGPFFESCDHGCRHGGNTHGVLGIGCEPVRPGLTQRQVKERNTRALRASDALFAYIETGDAYGSLVEIGMAQALGIPTRVLFGPDAPWGEMWYAYAHERVQWPRARVTPARYVAQQFEFFLAGVSR